jgi:hypothetical protein
MVQEEGMKKVDGPQLYFLCELSTSSTIKQSLKGITAFLLTTTQSWALITERVTSLHHVKPTWD